MSSTVKSQIHQIETDKVAKRRVLFVGSFLEKAKDGGVGGQMFACRSLLHSHLKESVEFLLIDSTSPSVPPPPVFRRGQAAFLRLMRFFKISLLQKPDIALIFCVGGFSMIEKGAMALILKFVFGKPYILAPRSGLIPSEVQKSKFMRWYVSLLVNHSKAIICQGKRWQNFFYELSDKSDKQKFISLPNWLDTQAYVDNRQSYSIEKKDQSLKILFLAWVDETKGIFDLIDAVHMLKSELTDQEFIIAGEGTAKQAAMLKARELGLEPFFKFVGWADTNAKMKLLKEADIFVFPSHFEGYPNSLIEAMVSHLPVISTRVGAVSEIVEDQVNGLLIDVKDITALAGAIRRLLREPETRLSLSKRARDFIVSNNSVDHAVSQFKILLSE
ncbi:MAG: glycosyltransferase family 4 protein [Pseudobdellovibrionaceae bacterium]